MSTKKRVLKSMGYPLAACAAFAVMNTAVFADTDENQPEMVENQASETTKTNDQQTSAEPSIEETEQQQQQDEIDQINEAIDEREKKQEEINAVPENNRTEESAVKNQEENEILKPAVQVKKAPAQQPLKANEAEKTQIKVGGYDWAWRMYAQAAQYFGYKTYKIDDLDKVILSFDDNGLFANLKAEDSYGQVRVGETVINPNDASTWKIIGFVPVMDPWYPGSPYAYEYAPYSPGNNAMCEKYFNFSSETEAKEFASKYGALYGEKPNEKLLSNHGWIMAVWYRKEIVVPTNQDSEYRDITPVPAVNYQKTTEGLIIEAYVPEPGEYPGVTNEHRKVIYTVTIPKGMAAKELNINVLDFMVKDEETGELKPVVIPNFQPGDTIEYEIHIIDESGEYKYKEKSGAEGTIPFAKEDYEEELSKGFEGYDIYKTDDKSHYSMFSRRGINRPLATLLKKGWGTDDIEELLYYYEPLSFSITDFLAHSLLKCNYGTEFVPSEGLNAQVLKSISKDVVDKYLHKYYLDWFSANNSEGKTYKSFDELSREQIGILYKSINKIQDEETNPAVASGLYWGFYERLYLISDNVDDNGKLVDAKGSYSWMKKPAGFTDEDGNSFDEVTSSQWKSSRKVVGDAAEYVIHYFTQIDGEFDGNNMQNTKFFIGVQFKLVKDEPDIPEPPKPEEPGEPEKPTPPEPEEPGEPVAPTPEQPKIEVATGVFVDAQLWISLMGASAVSLAGARRLKRRNRTK